MTCDRCGRRTANRNVCVECAREKRQEERARLEGTGALTFETTKICHDCRATSDNVDGEYLENNPGVWKFDDCREDDADAGAHVRFDIEKKGAVVETVTDSKDLIDYGGEAEIDGRSRRQREGWLECIVESDRWDSLGFAQQPFSTEVKVYQHSNWTSVSEDDPPRHPKLEASFAGVDRGALPHVSEFDDVLDHLRRVVATHALWAGVERGDLVADDYFDGPAAEP